MAEDDIIGMEAFKKLSLNDKKNAVEVLEAIGRGEVAVSATDNLSDDARRLVIGVIAKKVLGL